jgi:hypothetical protein
MTGTDGRLILLHPADSIVVLAARVAAGERLTIDGAPVTASATLEMGHKLARRRIEAGETVLKYGLPIGHATAAIEPGAHVHVHNLASSYTTVRLME